jgi:hypothetical protein
MSAGKTLPSPDIRAQRKLSEIIIEIARIGWKAPFRNQDPALLSIHILRLLATESWNREIQADVQHPNTEQRGQLVDR